MSKIMVNITYISGETNNLNMLNIDTDPRSSKIPEETKEECTDNDIVKPGLSNGCTKNKLYKDLLIDFGLSNFENSEIVKVYQNWISGQYKTNTSLRKSKYSYHLLTKGIDTQIKQLIIQSAEQGSMVDEISAVF